MAAEKNFENRVKKWLESIGVYPLGTPIQNVKAAPIGYYEKRWGGGTFTKSGLPDMHVMIFGSNYDLELKADNYKPTELQLKTIDQINQTGAYAFVLYDTQEGVKRFNNWKPKKYPNQYEYAFAISFTDFKELISKWEKLK